MKTPLTLFFVAGAACLSPPAVAQGSETAGSPEAVAGEAPRDPSTPPAPSSPEVPEATEPARTTKAAVAREAREPAETPKAEKAADRFGKLTVNFYGALLPFVESVSSDGATPPGFTGGASQVDPLDYTGFNDPPRFRMTQGTSNFGFRGTLALFPQLAVTWQVEMAVPIDGSGPPNTIASRNSHLGLTGDWGTLIFGHWDTPWKWATLVTVNPIKGSFVPDYTSILSTPGFGVSSVNTTSVLLGSISNASFYRREPNSIQYWSPTLAGFSLRLDYTLDEQRPDRNDVLAGELPNPYLLSGYVGFDGFGLRVRYAYEMHRDYFGMAQLGGTTPAPSPDVTHSTDEGHQLTLQYALSFPPNLSTRLVGVGELLSYKSDDTTPADATTGLGPITEYSRPAFYALLEQTIYRHHVWVAYGQAMPGKCKRVRGGDCTTTGLRATLGSVGYMFAFNENTNVHLVGYQLFNDVSSWHSTFPPLPSDAPGADLTGVGLGLFYAWDIGLYP